MKYFGKTSDEEYEDLRRRSKNGEFDNLSQTQSIANMQIDLRAKSSTSLPLNVGHKVIDNVYKSLGITQILRDCRGDKKYKYDLDEVMRLLIFGRCLDPQSKSKTVGEFQKTLFGNWNVSQNDMVRSLDYFEKAKDKIQVAMHENIVKNIGRTAMLVFYDVTNYYVETDIENNLRKKGYSKGNRKNPIIQMGLFMDAFGIPISYMLFPGNCTDPITYMPAVEQVKKQFGIERVVTVADKAMNSAKNITDAINKGDGYLFSSKFRGQKGSRKDLQEFALDCDGWEYNEDMTFGKKSVVLDRRLTNGQIVKEKVLVTWRKSYAIREKFRRDGMIDYVERLSPSQTKRVLIGRSESKYYSVTMTDEDGNLVKLSPLINIDRGKVAFDELFDGMNVITTSEVEMSDDDMINAYGELCKIEDCFRVTKTDLHARPIFVRTEEHIESHFLICFIALTIMRILQHKLGGEYSVGRIIKALASVNVNMIGNDIAMMNKGEDALKICSEFEVQIEKQFYKMEELAKM